MSLAVALSEISRVSGQAYICPVAAQVKVESSAPLAECVVAATLEELHKRGKRSTVFGLSGGFTPGPTTATTDGARVVPHRRSRLRSDTGQTRTFRP